MPTYCMTDDEQRVAELIRVAFAGVTLGDGVGLMQGQGLDDYADEETLEAYRSQDEKLNWAAISAEQLTHCHSSLSFFDAEGMRFHLPAFLIEDLQRTYELGVIFHLTYGGDFAREQFSLLSDAQRSAVRAYLLLRLADPHYAFEHRLIHASLPRDWPEPASG